MNQDPTEVAERLISRSGNTFHCRVAEYFRARDWTVMLSPYYVDNATDKARELDLVCEKLFSFRDDFTGPQTIRVQLFVECKYLKDVTVFWFDVRNKEAALQLLDLHTPFKRNNTLSSEHHYIKPGALVAKLFETSGKREEGDPVYKALNQCLGGLIQNRTGPPLIATRSNQRVSASLKYPVIVCSDFSNAFRTTISGATPEKIAANFQLEVNYAYVTPGEAMRREYFLVDIVSFPLLQGFLDALDHELNQMQLLLRN